MQCNALIDVEADEEGSQHNSDILSKLEPLKATHISFSDLDAILSSLDLYDLFSWKWTKFSFEHATE